MVFYIYKIIGVNYIGSTNRIKQRCSQHKNFCFKKNVKNNYPIYQYIREKEIDIELEILFCYKKKCSKRIQLLVEQFYINKYDSVNNGLNNNNAFGADKKKTIRHNKTYREKNKEKIKKTTKKYREKNNKKLKNMKKEYYEKNKEEINNKRKVKINCPICKSLIRKYSLKKHQKTKKCLKAKNNKISQNEIDFKYNQTAYNEEGEFMNWY